MISHNVYVIIFILWPLLYSGVNGFIPSKALKVSAPGSKVHAEMTEKALLEIARRYYNDNLPTGVPPVPEGYNANELFTHVYGTGVSGKNFDDVISTIKSGTASVDTDKETKSVPRWHFDAESFELGHQKLAECFQVVMDLMKSVNDFHYGRQLMGKCLHPLQDFYSHSNWIEMGHKLPLESLGIPGKALGIPVAGPKVQTCVDCTRDFSDRVKSAALKFTPIGLGVNIAGGSENYIYSCEQNVIAQALTSGYYGGQEDDLGSPVPKPPGVGKCSHGGTLDGTSGQYAEGGINKDSTNSMLSPHDYLHPDAAAVAQNASIFWLSQIRDHFHNDTMFGLFLQLIPGSSLGFAVDISPSAQLYVNQIEAEIRRLLREHTKSTKDAPSVFLVAPFSRDLAGPVFVRTSDVQFEEAMFTGFTAIAAEEERKDYTINPFKRRMWDVVGQIARRSLVGGTIYVFTDGDPSDDEIQPMVYEDLAEKKISFHTINVATDLRARRHRRQVQVAAIGIIDALQSSRFGMENINGFSATGRVQDLGSLLSFLDYISDRNKSIIMSQWGKKSIEEHTFLVDSTVSQIDVVQQCALDECIGKMDLYGPMTSGSYKISRIVSTRYEKFGEFYSTTVRNPEIGQWTAKISNPSRQPYQLTILATSALKFTCKYLSIDDQGPHPGAAEISGSPLINTDVVLKIQTTDANDDIYLIFVQLISVQSELLSQQPIQTIADEKNGTFYAEITIPKVPFYVRLYGYDANGYPFARTMSTLTIPKTVHIDVTSPRNLVVGQEYQLQFAVKNHGANDIFAFHAVDSQGWVRSYDPKGMLINENDTATGVIHLQIPNYARSGASSVVTLIAVGPGAQAKASWSRMFTATNRGTVLTV